MVISDKSNGETMPFTQRPREPQGPLKADKIADAPPNPTELLAMIRRLEERVAILERRP